MLQIWDAAVDSVRHRLAPEAFNDFRRAIAGVHQEQGRLVVLVRGAVQRDWITDQYLDLLVREVRRLSEEPLEVVLQVEGDLPPSSLTPIRDVEADGPDALTPVLGGPSQPARGEATGLNPRSTFDTFVVGSSNEMAASAAQSVASKPGDAYNPLFLYSGVGLGKTHLLHAIGQRILEADPNARVLYRSAESYMNDFIRSIGDKSMERFRQRYREECDVLLVDDVQFLSGKEATQEEFFHTFEALRNSGRQVCLTSDRQPRDILNLADRLRSRFEWGLLVDIQPPALETRLAIVRTKAEREGLILPDDVGNFLAETFKGSIREMEGCLNRLGAFAAFSNRPITLDFAREVLGDQLPMRRQPTAEDVMRAVADHFQLKLADLKGRRRHRSIARPRQVAMYLCRQKLDKSYPEIGREFGKDHSTVISACRKVEELLQEDAVVRTAVDVLGRRFNEA
jgi:chromosomal replication initiator protein